MLYPEHIAHQHRPLLSSIIIVYHRDASTPASSKISAGRGVPDQKCSRYQYHQPLCATVEREYAENDQGQR
jgi:hypothetical protein